MATPLKPWERRGMSSLPDVASNGGSQGNEMRRGIGDTTTGSPVKPSVPPRPSSVGNSIAPNTG